MQALRKVWELLTYRQRTATLGLLGLMIVGMALEMLGVGLVLPALALMASASQAQSQSWFGPLTALLGNPTREQLVAAGMLVLAGVYTLKMLFLAYLAWRQMSFTYGVQAEVSHRLFQTYLRQPYAFHLQRNSAQLIRNAVSEINVFCHTLLMSALIFLTEALVLIGVAVVLIAMEPVGALSVVAILGVLGYLFHRTTRGPVLRWGEARQLHEGRRIQHLQQGLSGVKDVLLLGREREFLAQYQEHNLGSAGVSRKRETLNQLPRLGLEWLAVLALAVLVILMLRRGTPLDAILPTIGLFAAAGFRIMPSLNRVINALHSVRYALPVVTTLHDELSLATSAADTQVQRLTFKQAVRMVAVTYSYPQARSPALEQIDLTIECGSMVGFIGGSGAGKSTLADVLLGLLQPSAGRVEVDGEDIARNPRGWQQNIGYVPQAIFLTDDTLRRNIAFGIANEHIDEEAVWRALRAAQLDEYVASLPEALDTMVGERGVRLSGGQLQRIGIARALYHEPSVLVLDEATSALDVETEQGVMQSVATLHGRKTVVVIAHRLSTLRGCDRIFRLERSRLVAQGAADEMIASFGRLDFGRQPAVLQ